MNQLPQIQLSLRMEREKQPEPEKEVDGNRYTETKVRETMRWKERGKGQFRAPLFYCHRLRVGGAKGTQLFSLKGSFQGSIRGQEWKSRQGCSF